MTRRNCVLCGYCGQFADKPVFVQSIRGLDDSRRGQFAEMFTHSLFIRSVYYCVAHLVHNRISHLLPTVLLCQYIERLV